MASMEKTMIKKRLPVIPLTMTTKTLFVDSQRKVSLTEGAHTGSTFAVEVASKSGRSCTYVPASDSLQLGYAAATRVIWEDEELKTNPATSFPPDASPDIPKSCNDILGSGAT